MLDLGKSAGLCLVEPNCWISTPRDMTGCGSSQLPGWVSDTRDCHADSHRLNVGGSHTDRVTAASSKSSHGQDDVQLDRRTLLKVADMKKSKL